MTLLSYYLLTGPTTPADDRAVRAAAAYHPTRRLGALVGECGQLGAARKLYGPEQITDTVQVRIQMREDSGIDLTGHAHAPFFPVAVSGGSFAFQGAILSQTL
ncbi:hypothetical protein [Nocardia sp. GAS34]|uniref:hypothetical protein n=1 Tax=unclassified Nocardia TaxID=2637762 RepID=UPI003D196691